jgi:hypothetical protein
MCRAGDITIHQTLASISSFICIRKMVQSLLYRFQSFFLVIFHTVHSLKVALQIIAIRLLCS